MRPANLEFFFTGVGLHRVKNMTDPSKEGRLAGLAHKFSAFCFAFVQHNRKFPRFSGTREKDCPASNAKSGTVRKTAGYTCASIWRASRLVLYPALLLYCQLIQCATCCFVTVRSPSGINFAALTGYPLVVCFFHFCHGGRLKKNCIICSYVIGPTFLIVL